MKIRLKNIQNKNRQKQHLLAVYQRNAVVVHEAFQVIKEGSGITSIDEIVTSFIKAEEQNYALWNYVNQLGQECDLYEDRIAQIDKDIARYEQLANMNNHELQRKVVSMGEETEDLKKQIVLSTDEVNDVQEEFDEIQQVVMDLVKQFQLAKFSTKVGQRMQYSDETNFNENNITMYLSELEEYFATLITYIATQRGDNNAAISSIPLDMLHDKQFDKRQIEITAPYEANTTND
jgi:hypothetical protein